jgi:hypothetical protein
MEFFSTRFFALALGARAHFYFGEDVGGSILDGGMAYGTVGFNWYW